MKTAENWLIDSYLKMLRTLRTDRRRDLISKLTLSVTTDSKEDSNIFWESFGGWDQNESAEEIINSIRGSRHFTRNIESL